MNATVMLGDIATIGGRPVNPQAHPDEAFRYYSIPDYDHGVPSITVGASIHSNKTLVDADDVLVSKLNPRIPRVWLVESQGSERAICSTEFVPVRRRRGVAVDSWFLRYIMLAPQFMEALQAGVRSSTRSHQRVRPDAVMSQRIPLPPLPEQRRIVGRIRECMARIDELRELRTRALEEGEGLVHRAIDSVLGDCPDSATLAEVTSDIQNGWSGKQASDGGVVGVLRLSCVHSMAIDANDTRPATVSPRSRDEFQLRKNDVYLVRGNGSKRLVGRSALAEQDREDVIFGDLLIRLRFGRRVLPEFANIALHSRFCREQIESLAKTAAGIWKVNHGAVGAIRIPTPALGVQQAAVERVTELRQATTQMLTEMRAESAESLASKVLEAAFAGKL